MDASTASLPGYLGQFANTSLVFHIILTEELVLNDSGTQILGETAQDTNPFGPDVAVFHAGTKLDAAGALRASGGRVLNVCARGATLQQIRGIVWEYVATFAYWRRGWL